MATPTDPKLLDSKRYEDLWPEGFTVPADSAEVYERLHRVAMASLSRQTQREAFQRWLLGETTTEIAKATRRDPEAVHRTLYGSPSRGLKGVVEIVKEALRNDETFRAAAQKPEQPPDPLGRHAIAEWFVGAPPDRFVEMAALLVFQALADVEGRLTVSQAYGSIHPSIVTHALPRLRLGGFIQTNGISIEVLRTPGGKNA